MKPDYELLFNALAQANAKVTSGNEEEKLKTISFGQSHQVSFSFSREGTLHHITLEGGRVLTVRPAKEKQ